MLKKIQSGKYEEFCKYKINEKRKHIYLFCEGKKNLLSVLRQSLSCFLSMPFSSDQNRKGLFENECKYNEWYEN